MTTKDAISQAALKDAQILRELDRHYNIHFSELTESVGIFFQNTLGVKGNPNKKTESLPRIAYEYPTWFAETIVEVSKAINHKEHLFFITGCVLSMQASTVDVGFRDTRFLELVSVWLDECLQNKPNVFQNIRHFDSPSDKIANLEHYWYMFFVYYFALSFLTDEIIAATIDRYRGTSQPIGIVILLKDVQAYRKQQKKVAK